MSEPEIVRTYLVQVDENGELVGKPERVTEWLVPISSFKVLDEEVARELASGRSIHLFDDGRELTIGPHGGWWHGESQTKFREVPVKS